MSSRWKNMLTIEKGWMGEMMYGLVGEEKVRLINNRCQCSNYTGGKKLGENCVDWKEENTSPEYLWQSSQSVSARVRVCKQ